MTNLTKENLEKSLRSVLQAHNWGLEMINDKLSITAQKILNNMCKHPKSAIFYLALFIFTIWGSLTSFHLICQYVEKTKEPKSLLNLYIYRDGVASLYRNLIFLFILNGLGIFYVIKNISINKLINVISIFIGIMFLFLTLKSYDFFPFKQIPNNLSFFYISYVGGNILFDNPYATINQTILGFWFIIFFFFNSKIKNSQKITKSKLSVIIILTTINMFVFPFFFPQFFIK